MKNIILKENGQIIDVLPYTEEVDRALANKHKIHLCWDSCVNACAGKCTKIANMPKKAIGKYEFITDGYQVVKEYGAFDKFIVSGCKNYVRDKRADFNFKQRADNRKKRENLKMAYFDTETIEEAHILQAYLINKELLKDARGKKISSDQLSKMKRKIK